MEVSSYKNVLDGRGNERDRVMRGRRLTRLGDRIAARKGLVLVISINLYDGASIWTCWMFEGNTYYYAVRY